MAFQKRTLAELSIEGEKSFRHIALYAKLKERLIQSKYSFRLLPKAFEGRWDHALLLNLSFWSAEEEGDILIDEQIEADVVTHVAWHHLAARNLAQEGLAPSADALFFGESIASAFDAYLVGRLLGHNDSSFIESQVPAMWDVAEAAGLSEEEFDALLQSMAADPERAFEDLRQLLFDLPCELLKCKNADDALQVLKHFETHRFASLLHRYEISNWVLYARAHASHVLLPDPRVREIDTILRSQKDSLAWMEQNWLR